MPGGHVAKRYEFKGYPQNQQKTSFPAHLVDLPRVAPGAMSAAWRSNCTKTLPDRRPEKQDVCLLGFASYPVGYEVVLRVLRGAFTVLKRRAFIEAIPGLSAQFISLKIRMKTRFNSITMRV